VYNKIFSSLLITGDLNYSDIQWNDQGGFCKRTGRPSSIRALVKRSFLPPCLMTVALKNNSTINLVSTLAVA
jgi:hypothetical protein